MEFCWFWSGTVRFCALSLCAAFPLLGIVILQVSYTVFYVLAFVSSIVAGWFEGSVQVGKGCWLAEPFVFSSTRRSCGMVVRFGLTE